MKTHKKKVKAILDRVYWREFVQTNAFRWMQNLLRLTGYELNVVFDPEREAMDVFVSKLPASAARGKSA